MKKNYKRYWEFLKQNQELSLSFSINQYGVLRHALTEVELWKAGLSRYKYLDHTFQRKFPAWEIAYSLEIREEESEVVLTARLRSKSEINPNNPKILLPMPKLAEQKGEQKGEDKGEENE